MPEDPTPEGPAQADAVGAVASLGEPTRRALYEYVAGSGGLGRARYRGGCRRPRAGHRRTPPRPPRRPTDCSTSTISVGPGRRGPGRGAPREAVPPRRVATSMSRCHRATYELAGSVARRRGRYVASRRHRHHERPGRHRARRRAAGSPTRSARRHRRRRRARPARRRVVLDALADRGFEPRPAGDGTVVLRNCPFHTLARQHTDLICGMNLCLLDAAIDGVGETGLDARLEPEEGFCCVKLHA